MPPVKGPEFQNDTRKSALNPTYGATSRERLRSMPGDFALADCVVMLNQLGHSPISDCD